MTTPFWLSGRAAYWAAWLAKANRCKRPGQRRRKASGGGTGANSAADFADTEAAWRTA